MLRRACLLSLLVAAPALGQSEPGADVAAPYIPEAVTRVLPGDGATVPSNARATFAVEQRWNAAGVEGTVATGGDTETLMSNELSCPAEPCLGVLEPTLPLSTGATYDLEVGTNLEGEPAILTWTVGEEADETPPTLGEPTLTAEWQAYGGEHTGYRATLNSPAAEDDFGVAAYIAATNGDEDATPTTLLDTLTALGDGNGLSGTFSLPASKEKACAEIRVVDFAGNEARSEVVCTELVPPTEEELAESEARERMSGGCRCVAPAGAGSGLGAGLSLVVGLGLALRRRRG